MTGDLRRIPAYEWFMRGVACFFGKHNDTTDISPRSLYIPISLVPGMSDMKSIGVCLQLCRPRDSSVKLSSDKLTLWIQSSFYT